MTKKTKIILISVVSVFALILISLLTLLLVLPNQKNTEIKETKIEDVILYDIPVNKDKVVDYAGRNKVITLSAKPIEKDAFLEETIIFIYEDGYVSKNDIYSSDKVLHSSYKIEVEEINNFLSLLKNITECKSINNVCKSGNIYTVTDNKNNISYSSCDSCVSEVYHCFMDIKCAIERK